MASVVTYVSCQGSNAPNHPRPGSFTSATPPSIAQTSSAGRPASAPSDAASLPNSIYVVDGDVAYIPAGALDSGGSPLLGQQEAARAILTLPEVKEIAAEGAIQVQPYCYPREGCAECWWCFTILALSPGPVAIGYRFQVDARDGSVLVAEPTLGLTQQEPVPYGRWHQALEKLRRSPRTPPSPTHGDVREKDQ